MADIQDFSVTKGANIQITVKQKTITYRFTDIRTGEQIGDVFIGNLGTFLAQFTTQQVDDAYNTMIFNLLLIKASTI